MSNGGIVGSAVTMLMNIVTRKYVVPWAKKFIISQKPRKEILELIKLTESGQIRWTKQKVESVIFYAKVSWWEYRVQNNDVGFLIKSDVLVMKVFQNDVKEEAKLGFLEHKKLLKVVEGSEYTVEIEPVFRAKNSDQTKN